MPTYQFHCDPDEGGCNHVVEIRCSFKNKELNRPKSCPKCRKRKSIVELFGGSMVHIPVTLGSFADKKTGKMSEDERTHLKIKQNEYKKSRTESSWVGTPDGMVHKSKLEK